MLLLLSFLVLITKIDAYSDNVFGVMGLNTNFNIITPIIICNDTDYSCYSVLCNFLATKTPCISYAAFVPMTKYLNCSQMPPYAKTNIIVFGIHIYENNTIKIMNNITNCDTIGDCLDKGCNLYNSNYNIDWYLFTGQCLMN